MLDITPSNDYPVPDTASEQVAPTLQENARIAATTASLLYELGMPFEMTAEDEAVARKLFEQVDKKKHQNTNPNAVNPPALYQGNVALKLGALLNEYDHKVVLDATQARTYIMNRLLEISSCGEAKSELRALELMGKMSDVGAFTEKSEVTITHRTSGDLKQILQEKITRLLNVSATDVQVRDVKQELGLVEDVTPVEVVEDEDELGQYVAERAKQLQAGDSDESK
jgi:ribosomal protein S24E